MEFGRYLSRATGESHLNSSMAMHTYWITRTITDENGQSSPPGDIIQESLDELNVSLREFARAMEIAPSTASRLLTGKAALTPEMAIKLSVVIGSSPQMWLNLQNAWSLAEAEKRWMCRDCAVWLRNKKWRFLKRHFQLKVQKRLYPFFTLFFASAFSISRYQRGWCFFAQRRLTFLRSSL